ncbi:MAG: NHLP family bacteriocin export ABC transporter peptidase/permease/ATPase subunit [Oscillospiraceae bacterium]|jgi:NHLM bacteriocin system ABC transporter peptidase/ATP-binding protein|nr:NHLP family bacteriocin export ABC transporter peptidase/permease/ATPase subunit [Oscillospiraceae bacterium]
MATKIAKVPVVIQMEALECGAASLAMILAYFGKWVPLEQVRSDCGVSRDGSNLKYMTMAARSYGLTPNAFKCDLKTVREAKLPAIIHWNFNHFVVLNGFEKDKVSINDPARGTVKVSMKEFDESFTGILVSFEKNKDFKPGGKPDSVLEFALKRLSGTLVPFLFVIITSFLTTATGLVSPAFGRIFQDKILSNTNPDWLYPFIFCFAAVVFFEIIVSLINNLYMLKIQGKLAIVANSGFIWHVLRLPIDFFSQRMVGDIISRQSLNETIASTLIGKFAPILLNLGTLIFYLIVMVRYNFWLSLIGIAAAVFNTFFGKYVANKRSNIQRIQSRDSGKAISSTMSGIEMIETIKSAGAENGFFGRWAGYQASLNSTTVKFAKINQYLGSISTIVSSFIDILIRTICIWLIMTDDTWSIGKLSAFTLYLGSFMNPVNQLIGVMQSLTQMRTDMERVQDVLKYKPDVEYDESNNHDKKEALVDASENNEKTVSDESNLNKKNNVETPSAKKRDENLSDKVSSKEFKIDSYKKLSGSLEMKNVTFGYNKLSDPLIKDFNLSLKPGSRVAFVGFSGCGKSTLAKLISGLYKPWSGEISFDGKKMQEIDRQVLTGSLAVVDQDIIMFADTISNNIKMWDESIEDFEMILAARDAQIHNDILIREGGYNHPVLEGGKDFSGGQRQRFEIARVLAQDPTIIVLDEATSALDAKTEYDVAKAVKDRGITCVIVAHRLSTIRDCDEIIVMEKGEVIERGTHDELYTSGKLYKKLVATE